MACVATDIITGDEVILDEGSVLEAVRASISIPVIFTVVKRQGRYLVDGGLVNQIPISVVKKMGADFVIAVDITPKKNERAEYLTKNQEETKEPGIFQVIIQTIYLGTYSTSKVAMWRAPIVNNPSQLSPYQERRRFQPGRECIFGTGEVILAVGLGESMIKRRLKEAGIALNNRNQDDWCRGRVSNPQAF